MWKRKERDDDNHSSKITTSGQNSSDDNNGILDYVKQEFDKLPQEEQEFVYRDLYGTEEIFDENVDPTFVPQKLQQLDNAIEQLVATKREAYDLATLHCPEYVNSCRLKFLRATSFDVQKAAKRMFKYWELKVQLWGAEVACQGKIKLDDLDEDDMVSLRSGGARLLSGKDRAGRGILWLRSMDYKYTAHDNMLRAVWFVVMQATDDVEIQKTGLITIGYGVGPFKLNQWDRDLAKQIVNMISKALPVRAIGGHQCYDDVKLKCIMPLIMVFTGKTIRQRIRLHSGSHSDCLFKLMTYGIPMDVLPVDFDGNIEIDNHLQWIEECREGQNDSLEYSFT